MKIPLVGTANTFSFQFNLDIGTGHKSMQESKWKAFAEKIYCSKKNCDKPKGVLILELMTFIFL